MLPCVSEPRSLLPLSGVPARGRTTVGFPIVDVRLSDGRFGATANTAAVNVPMDAYSRFANKLGRQPWACSHAPKRAETG